MNVWILKLSRDRLFYMKVVDIIYVVLIPNKNLVNKNLYYLVIQVQL